MNDDMFLLVVVLVWDEGKACDIMLFSDPYVWGGGLTEIVGMLPLIWGGGLIVGIADGIFLVYSIPPPKED